MSVLQFVAAWPGVALPDFASLDVNQLDFGQHAVGMGVAVTAAVVASLLSSWLILVGWSLMGDAVSHAVVPGVVLAFMFGVPLAVGALVFAIIAVTLIGMVRTDKRLREDTAIGVVFTSLFAFGLFLISLLATEIDLEGILFGDLYQVNLGDLIQMLVIGGVVVFVLLIKRRDLMLFAFDPTHAAIIGLNTRLLSAVLLGSLALTAVISMQAVGVILVVAMLITPGATARLITSRFNLMLVIAPIVGGSSAIAGYSLGLVTGASAGALIVMVQGAIFAIAYLATTFKLSGRRQ